MIEEFEKYTTMMYRPPEMIDKYKKYRVDTQADIWVGYTKNIFILFSCIDAWVCGFQFVLLLTSILRFAEIWHCQCSFLHAK